MNSIGLYLHIPFCDGKCSYCNFFSQRADDKILTEYTQKLIAGISDWGHKLDRTVDTVYFGGGTPSLLGHKRLISILDNVYQSFRVVDNAEITVEVNPSSTEELDFSAMRTAGFNRLSVGLQSANEKELQLLGRRHSTADTISTVRNAQKAGFDNISLDVMLAIPGQTIESLDTTLNFCASCNVQHISAYILKIEKGTKFFNEKENLELFSDDEQAVFYEHTVAKLTELGYRQYEISNFSLSNRESHHNLHYWHDDEYLGLGPSAHSFIDGKRFYYDNSFQHFYENILTDESSGGSSEEYIMLALRLNEGLVFQRYEDRFHQKISKNLLSAARRLEQQGLCNVTEQKIALTVKGFLVSNAVIFYLLENT